MAGSRAVQENEVSKPPSAEAPSAPPLPFFVQRTGPAVVDEESSGDEVCYDAPLLAPRQSVDVIDIADASAAVADRGALARAKMQTLGCAKKDRKASDEDKKGAKQITSTAVRDRPEPPPEDLDSESERDDASEPSERRPWSTATSSTARSSTTWWAQFFHMKHGFGLGVASLKVSLARLDLSDTDLPSLTAALEKLLQHLRDEEADSEQRHRAPVRLLLELDLSDNGISDVGAVWLFSWLMQRPGEVRCRVLRMARNRLSDTSLEWLSALVCQQHSAIEELHLAENTITATGAAYLLLAFALHPFEAYPFLDPKGLFAPANVTLDRNPIEEPGLLARLRLRSNLRAACKDGNLRTSNFNSTPHVQLGATFPDGANRSSTVLPLALEKVCAAGSWPSLPQLPKPQVKETSGDAEAFNRYAPRGKTFRRELLVDDEEGAGLELETVSDGLRICEIMEIPGQPGLRLGDVIVAIDGLPLWWHACQRDQVEIDEDDDAPSARFRARFRRGARMDILRSEAPSATATRDSVAARSRKRFACPVCWDTFDLWTDCLEHLREFGHEPQVPTTSSKKLEDAAGSLRRWMATCMAATRGELPAKQNQNGVSAEKWMAVEEEKVPSNIFVDSEDRTLHFTASLPDGNKLPPWLIFDEKSRTFHGTPSKGDGGVLAVRITGHDSKGKSVSESFLLNVTGGIQPKAGGPMLPLHHFENAPKAAIGRNFYYKVPPGTFGHADGTTGPISYLAQRGDGRPLPEWLHFNRATGTFSGMPRATDTGPLTVEVFARDQKGSLTSDSFVVDVVSSDLESVVLRDAVMHTRPGSHNFWIMMMCVSLVFFAVVVLLVAVGVFGFKVSIKRRFMREKKDQAPGTLRHVSCCGAEYEQYSSVNKEDIEILPD